MTKTQRDSILAVIMVVLCIGAMSHTFYFSKKKKPAAPAAASAPAPSSVEAKLMDDAQFIGAVRTSQETAVAQAGRWEQDWERDPFLTEEIASSGGIENLVLKGVLWDEDPKAIINTKTLRKGEAIDGYQVMEIRPASVLLWTGEKNLLLRVFKSPFEQADPIEEVPPAEASTGSEAVSAALTPQPAPAKKGFVIPQGIGAITETINNLNKVESFITDTSGAERMAELMKAASPGGSAVTGVEKPKDSSSSK